MPSPATLPPKLSYKRSNSSSRTRPATFSTTAAESGILFGKLRMNDTQCSSGVQATVSPLSSTPRPSAADETSDGTSREVAADPVQCQPRQDLGRLLPGRHHGIVPLQPLRVGRLDVDRHAAEAVRPLDLDAEHVRVAGRDRRQTADLAYGLDQSVVDVARRIPEQVAGRRLDEQRTLADPDRRLDRDSQQAGFDLAERPGVAFGSQLLQGGPPLARRAHVLPFVAADGTGLAPAASPAEFSTAQVRQMAMDTSSLPTHTHSRTDEQPLGSSLASPGTGGNIGWRLRAVGGWMKTTRTIPED